MNFKISFTQEWLKQNQHLDFSQKPQSPNLYTQLTQPSVQHLLAFELHTLRLQSIFLSKLSFEPSFHPGRVCSRARFLRLSKPHSQTERQRLSKSTESYNHQGWKRPLRSSSPTANPTPPCLLNHVLKCHIYTVFEHLSSLLVRSKHFAERGGPA